jgi:DNA-binding MarR family transcriptional regulator
MVLMTERPTVEPSGQPRAERPGESREEPLTDLALTLDRALDWVRRLGAPTPWSPVALATLDALERFGPQRVTDLVAREQISQPGMTGLLTRLAAAGLVHRRTDSRDARVTRVQLTDHGREYLRHLREQRTAAIVAVLGTLPDAQRRALHGAMPALAALASRPDPP